MAEREYHVYDEVANDLGTFDNPEDAETAAEEARKNCPCEEDPGSEGLHCGVLKPHGIHAMACEDGWDVTQDYLING